MPILTNLSPASSYGTVLVTQTNPISSTLQPIMDGYGTLTPLRLSTTSVNIDTSMGPFYINGTALTATATQINSVCAQNTFLGTSGVVIPNGTTAQRPMVPATGILRYNMSTDQIEGYLTSGWSVLSADAVTSVTGTAGRITASPTTGNVVVDIDAGYVGQASITTLGTITSGSWNGSTVLGQYGGTGVNNAGKTITLGGNLTTSGAFNSTFTFTGDTNVTFPTSGTLLTTATSVTSVSGTANQIDSTGGGAPVLSFSSTAVFPGTVTLNADPTAPLEAVTKQYADAIAANINYKAATYAASTIDLTVTYANGAAGVGATLTNAGALAAFSIDGVSPPLNSRILIKNQASSFQNGIYTLTTVGSGAVNWVLTRATDYDQPAEIFPGNVVPVNNGTVNAATSWLESATVVTIGTDPISFTQFTFANPVTSVTGTADRITSSGGQTPVIDIASTYVGQTSITTLGTIGTGTWQGNIIGLAYGGSNANLTASNGGIVYSTASAMAILSGTPTAGKILISGASAAPLWSPNVELTDDGTNLAITDSLGAFSGGPDSNTVFGVGIMQSAVNGADGNSLFGYQAGAEISTGQQNSAFGYRSGNLIQNGNNNASFGYLALSTNQSSSQNCAFGSFALNVATTANNCAFGFRAAQSHDTGLLISAFGAGALFSNTNGSNNSAFGYNALNLCSSGNNNFAAGATAGALRATYNNCTFIGYGADATVTGLSNATAIGYNAQVTTSNSLILGSGANVGIGTSSPTSNLHVVGTSILGTVSSGTWNGTVVGLGFGGTNANLTASNGGIFYSTASAGAILSGTATANRVLLSGATAAPAWSTATYPATTTANQLLYSSATNTVTELASANNGVLITSGAGVPSISTTLPSAVQGNITSVGTVTSGTWTGTTIAVANGGTGLTFSTPVIQSVRNGTASVITCNIVIPVDNTIPQNTEGVEVITALITPKNASNILIFDFSCSIGQSVAANFCVALFQGSAAGAIACQYGLAQGGSSAPFTLRYYMAAGSTSTTTYRVRVGPNVGTAYVNGDNLGNRLYGGVSFCSLTITEIAP